MLVMPAQAGIQGYGSKARWVPAYAGTTEKDLERAALAQ
jgi:hypothetical protein